MLGCNEVVTLVRHIREKNADRYECVIIPRASWFAKRVVKNTANGFTSGNVLMSRIPDGLLTEDQKPRTGDYLVRGEVNEVTSPADLKDTEYFAITSVGDNRLGNLSHWVVSGA